MKILRYESQGQISYGVLEGDCIKQLAGGPYEGIACTGQSVPLVQARLLAPSEPKSIVAVGLNYKQHSVDLEWIWYPSPWFFQRH